MTKAITSGGCWAAQLGRCGGGISREHLVSKCVFPDQSIFVKGLDWCLDEPKEVRIETLTAKILCKDHNSALSELDSEAGSAFNSIRDFALTKMNREKMPYINWASKQLTVDSRKLERWCLKTLLNFSFGKNLIIGPGTHEAGTVPVDLARVAFGRVAQVWGSSLTRISGAPHLPLLEMWESGDPAQSGPAFVPQPEMATRETNILSPAKF